MAMLPAGSDGFGTMRRIAVLYMFAFAALSACATPEQGVYPRAPHYPPAPYAQPQGPTIYASAAFATLHSELFACNSYGSNIGARGARNEVLAYTPYMHTNAGALMRNPTEGACLSSGFGWRGSANGGGREHTGLDLANANGGFVYAAADGWIVRAGDLGGYGIVIEIDHGERVRTLYAHLAEYDPRLRPGMFVPSGAPIGRMGRTGNATGVHLHYEVSIDGVRVDPLTYGAPPAAAPAPVETLPVDDKPVT